MQKQDRKLKKEHFKKEGKCDAVCENDRAQMIPTECSLIDVLSRSYRMLLHMTKKNRKSSLFQTVFDMWNSNSPFCCKSEFR